MKERRESPEYSLIQNSHPKLVYTDGISIYNHNTTKQLCDLLQVYDPLWAPKAPTIKESCEIGTQMETTQRVLPSPYTRLQILWINESQHVSHVWVSGRVGCELQIWIVSFLFGSQHSNKLSMCENSKVCGVQGFSNPSYCPAGGNFFSQLPGQGNGI